MKIRSVLLSAIVAVSVFAGGHSGAENRTGSLGRDGGTQIALQPQLTADPLDIPAALQARIDAAITACRCFTSVTPWQVIPAGAATDVFRSPDILSALLELDVQLPWVAAGEVNGQALTVKLTPSGQTGVLAAIARFADPSGGGYRIGAYTWSHPTAPDFCSGETLYLMYFERTGVLFAFRFDSSHEC